MRIDVLRFNIYLLALALSAGCASGPTMQKKADEEEASLRLHLEVNPDGAEDNGPITIGRAQPFQLNVQKTAFLTEFQIEKASVVDVIGGYSMSIQFNKQGAFLLEMQTTAHRGKRLAISAEFGEMRWIAAPVIKQRITDGLLVFTPDTTRAEAERIVNGLNRFIKRTTWGELK